jgi:hypothetical protein
MPMIVAPEKFWIRRGWESPKLETKGGGRMPVARSRGNPTVEQIPLAWHQ